MNFYTELKHDKIPQRVLHKYTRLGYVEINSGNKYLQSILIYRRHSIFGAVLRIKNSKRFWTKIRLKQATDSIQNSSGKPNHQEQLGNQITGLRAIGKPNHWAKGNWETKSLG